MASLEARVTALESDFNDISQSLASCVRTRTVAELEKNRDQINRSHLASLTDFTKQLADLSTQVSLLRSEAVKTRKPRVFTITGGALTYTITHALGFRPVVQVLGSTFIVVSSAVISHVDESSFTVVVTSPTFKGSVLYI